MNCSQRPPATGPHTSQLKGKLYSAIGRSMASRYLVYAANLVSLMILARIFAPKTFGAIASVSVLLTFFQIVSEAGLGPAIINSEKISNADRNGIFSLTLIVGLILSILFLSSTPWIASFYKSEDIYKIVPFAAASLFFYSAAILPTASLLKDQKFSSIAVAGLLSESISTATSILLSLKCDPITSLAAKSLCSSFISAAMLHKLSQKTSIGETSLGKDLFAIRPLLAFSMLSVWFQFCKLFRKKS